MFKIIIMKNTLIYTILIFCFLIFCVSCKENNSNLNIDSKTELLYGLASPILLNYDTTEVILSDYFNNLDEVTEITYPNGLKPLSSKINDTLILISKDELEPISTLLVKVNSILYNIPVLKSTKQKYVYTFEDKNHQYQRVGLAGEMNAWNSENTQLVYNEGQWVIDLFLEPDKYSYLVVLDGNRQLDPFNPIKLSNGMGGWNSELTIGTKSSEINPKLITKSIKSDTIIMNSFGENLHYLVLFQNKVIKSVNKGNEVYIPIPKEAKDKKRTYIRIWAFNKSMVSGEVFIPLDFGKVLTKGEELTRQDKETNIMYYIMVDRFKNLDKSNDAPLNDPEVHPKADHHGGDLDGVTEVINSDYFKNLGITSLWLSPIVQNTEGKYGFFNKKEVQSKFSGYHGYWPTSFTKTDYRFGTDEDLKELVNAAHSKNSNVLLDIVANHVHENHPVYQANKDKDWATNLYLPDGSLNTEKWDEHRLTTWFDVFLPSLNLENPEVAEMLSDSAMYLLDEFNVDGFRHDATKHIPLSFWRMLTKKVNQKSIKTGKKYYQVGETYGTPKLISSYIGSGMLDAQFDFNIYDALVQTIVKEDVGFSLLEQKLNQSIKYYGVHNLMGYMTGNQDKPRFMALVTEDVSLSEDSKYAGWSREITKKTPEGFGKLSLMHAFIMTLPGVPVIYYGDEIGMTGGNDPDNRRDMKFDNLNESETSLLSKVSKLTHLRRNNPVFLFGDLKFEEVGDKTIVYSRNYFGKSALVFMNNSNSAHKFKVSTDFINPNNKFNTTFGSEIIENEIEIAPYSFEVVIVDK